ncbi:MAG: hypothetical protein CMH48_10845 [Muricauda sp.]|nr:DUF2752 domain-containing protein [Allomuricauda sp.]MBC31330.1 hypothetical protein [Allomuricauda sp.]
MNIFLSTYLLSAKKFMLPCFNKQLLGFDCPGCGIQRALYLLLQGDFVAAFKMYPAIYFLVLLFSFLVFNKFYSTKYANKIIILLSISSVATIIISYIIKLSS